MGMRQGNRKRVRELRRSLRRKRLAMALVAAFAMPIAPVLAQSLPENGTVTHGSASINTSGSTMTVQQGTPGAIIDWGTFNIATGNSVAFLQPDTSSVTLNRVVTFGAPSLIDGTLTANGSVFLVNPAGIAFGSGAQVNVGGLIASTLDIADADFVAGLGSAEFIFDIWNGERTLVDNAGSINAGQVAFIGRDLANSGLIDAGSAGKVMLLAQQSVGLWWDSLGSSPYLYSFHGGGDPNPDQIRLREGSDIRGQYMFVDSPGGSVSVTGNVSFHGTFAALFAGGGTVSIGSNCGGVFCGAGYVNSYTQDLRLGGNVVQVLSGSVGAGPEQYSRIVLYGDSNGIATGMNFDAGGTVQFDAGIEISAIPGATITTRGESFDIDDTARILADTWNVYAPSWEIIHSGETAYGAFLTDGLLSNTLDNGTSIGIYADGASTSGSIGSIRVNEGVTITHATDDAVALGLVAASYIYGNDFSIESTGGALDLSFEANDGVIALFDTSLVSNGGNISLDGVGERSGVTLGTDTISAGNGDITIAGAATQENDRRHGVAFYGSSISTTGGSITVVGDGTPSGVGITFVDSSIATTTGDILVSSTGRNGLNGADVPFSTDTGSIHLEGHAQSGDGVYIGSGGLTTNGGDISIIGSSVDGAGVVVTYGAIDSNGGDISIWGDSESGDFGVFVYYFSRLSSDGGDITITGAVDGANTGRGVAIWYDSEVSSGGGDISISGNGGVRGVSLSETDVSSDGGAIAIDGQGGGVGVVLIDSDLTSDGGDIDVTGAGNYYGVNLIGTDLASAGGDISVVGDGIGNGIIASAIVLSSESGDLSIEGFASSGAGINFNTSDSSVTTTSGDISVVSTGLTGLNVADVPFITDSGDIHLEGHALVSGPGVYVGNGGLTTNGGDITLIGDSVDGFGVHVRGDIASHGGSISITGASDSTYLVSYGVLVNDGVDIASDGGDIVMEGDSAGGSGVWLNLEGGGITSGGGNITLTGAGGGLGGVDILYGVVDSAGGVISIYGTVNGSATGVALESAGLSSSGGNIDIVGHTDTNAPGVWVRDSDIVSAGGGVDIAGSSAMGNGVSWRQSTLASSGGDITLVGSGQVGGFDVQYGTVSSGAGDLAINGNATNGVGITFDSGSSITTTSGTISIVSTGLTGLNLATLPITTDTGDIHLEGHAQSGPGVYVGSGGLTTNGGDITIDGTSEADSYDNGSGAPRPAGVVVMGDIASNGGDIAIHGSSPWYEGVIVDGADIITSGGMITLVGQGGEFSANGVWVVDAGLLSGGGDIVLDGDGWYGGVDVFGGSLLDSGGGDIAITGTAVQRSAGGVFVRQSQILSGGGDIELAGFQENNSRGSGGLHLEESSVDAGGGQVTLSAGIGDGIGDAIVLRGSTIASTTAVNLHPINVNDTILLGAGNGFSLTGAELAMIDSPLVVIGGAQHAGAIRVLEAVDWDGDLTLQNQGGDAGIDLQAAVDVGDNILTLASGGDIGQTEAGGITAHSLLAIAGGNVALSSAENNVAASSLAGSAGGDFSYEDVDDLAISEVSSLGFSSVGQTGLVSLSAAGITAGGSVLVRTATGNLTLGADVSGNTIDLVAAETFQNTAGATLFAAEGWRVWARTWEGEQRGGLQNDDAFDIYGCAFGADCLGLGQGNQFVYQRVLEIPRPPETVAALVDGDDEGEDPLEQVHAGMVCPVGANAADPLGKGSGSDELAREWSKTRHRIRLSGCIDNSSQGGCRF